MQSSLQCPQQRVCCFNYPSGDLLYKSIFSILKFFHPSPLSVPPTPVSPDCEKQPETYICGKRMDVTQVELRPDHEEATMGRGSCNQWLASARHRSQWGRCQDKFAKSWFLPLKHKKQDLVAPLCSSRWPPCCSYITTSSSCAQTRCLVSFLPGGSPHSPGMGGSSLLLHFY